MKDSIEGTVRIPDVSKKIFCELLRYIYSDYVQWRDIDISELYSISHRYNVKGLQQLCATKLYSSLTTENVSERLQLGYTYSDPTLKENCRQYINGHLTEVINTEGYQILKKQCPEAVVSVLEAQIPKENRKRKYKEDKEEELTIDKINKLTVPALKLECAKRGLFVTGLKNCLRERLLNWLEDSKVDNMAW